MSSLEKLFWLEIEFHRRLRTQVSGTVDAGALHTSDALQCGYEPLIRAIGTVVSKNLSCSRTAWRRPWTPATSARPATR